MSYELVMASLRIAEAEIDRLRAELAEAENSIRATRTCADRDWNRAKAAEARLAAVLALCDVVDRSNPLPVDWRRAELRIMTEEIRAAATGDTK